MNTGWDPASELREALVALEQTPEARRVVGPPSRPVKAGPEPDDRPAAATPQAPDSDPVVVEEPGEPEPASEAPRRGRGRPARSAPARLTSAQIPAPLVEALTLRRLGEAAAGRRFVVAEWVNSQILALPTSAGGLARLLDTHAARINLDRAPRTDGWTPTRLLSLRLTGEADQHLNRLVLVLYQRDMRMVERQTLVALALVVGLV
jgi:hypothetical protein